MDYLITSFNFKDNTLIFNSEFRITELYLNDQQLPLTTKTDKSYAVDFTYLPISQLVFGRFHILAKVGEKLVRLKNTDFENVPESDRYFSVNGIPGAFVYLTINGYLNFSYLSSSSYLRIVERSYDNFDYETRDIEIQHFEISDNLVTLTKIPKFSEVVIMSQKDKEEYTVPFVRENGITKIDFSSLLNLGIDRYFVFLKIAEKNIRVRYTDVLKLDVQKRYFELKKKYSVLHPNFNKTQNYLYFSVNGRLAFIKSPQKNFKWNNYTGTIEAEILKFDLLSNNLSIQFTDLLEDDYSLELRDGQKVIELYPTEKSSDKLNFNFNDTSIDLKAKYLVSLKSINKNNELYNYLLRINHERDGKVLTKDYTVSQFSEQRLLYLMFNDRQFFYTKEKIIIAKSKFINKNTIIIVPETYVFDSIPKIIAQSRSSSIMHQLLVEKEGNDFIVNIDDINRIRQHEIFDIYCLIGDEKYSFKNLDALKTPVSRRYQELEVDDYRLSLYSTLSGTLAFRKDEINEENRQLYKYRTDDLTISSIESNDEYIEFDLPDKVFDVIEVSLLPRKGTDLKDELSFEIEGETNKIKIFNLSKVRASQTKKIFNYFADYLLTWSDKKGSIHTSYLKAMNFELIEKPLRKFKPYNPRTEKYVLVQNYLNAAHNLSVQLKNLYYAENYERVSIDNNLVLYESRDGKSFVDSPLNIFQYLISHKQYKKLKHVVVFDDLDGEAAQYNQKNMVMK